MFSSMAFLAAGENTEGILITAEADRALGVGRGGLHLHGVRERGATAARPRIKTDGRHKPLRW